MNRQISDLMTILILENKKKISHELLEIASGEVSKTYALIP